MYLMLGLKGLRGEIGKGEGVGRGGEEEKDEIGREREGGRKSEYE